MPAGVVSQESVRVSPVVDAHPVLRRIADADRRVADEFTAVFEIRRPSWHDPKQGMQISRCTLTSGDGLMVLITENVFSADPIFRPPSTPGYQGMDFDGSGNLIVWRSLGKKAISTPGLNRVYDIQEMTLVAPSGRIVERVLHRQVYEYPIGSPDSMYEVSQMQMVTGRGFSKHLSAFKSERIGESGLLEVVATGTFGSAMPGEWTLELEPNQEQLVRVASFRAQGMDEPAIRVVTKGESPAGVQLPFASSGTLHFGRMDVESGIEVRVIDYRPLAPDPEDVGELREQLSGAIPDGMEVIDYSGNVPRRYVAGRADRE